MKISIHITPEFERMAKPLAKKYKSFENDYDTFLDELNDNPMIGIVHNDNVLANLHVLTTDNGCRSHNT